MLSYLGNLSGPSYRPTWGYAANGTVWAPTMEPDTTYSAKGPPSTWWPGKDSAGRILHSQGGVPGTPPTTNELLQREKGNLTRPGPYPELRRSGLLALCFHEHVLDMPSKKRAVYHSRARRGG